MFNIQFVHLFHNKVLEFSCNRMMVHNNDMYFYTEVGDREVQVYHAYVVVDVVDSDKSHIMVKEQQKSRARYRKFHFINVRVIE